MAFEFCKFLEQNQITSNVFTSGPSFVLVGVGPGDPSLLTVAAVEAIQKSTLIAYPVAKEGEESMAAKIASKWISDEKRRLPLLFPMVKDELQLKNAWEKAGDQLSKAVTNGEKVTFLCQGDVSLFSSASYIFLEMKARHPECLPSLIPGVNSFSAAAALGGWPLTIQRDQLLILPTPENPEELEKVLDDALCNQRVLVFLKLGHRWEWVRQILERRELLKDSLFAQKIGLYEEKVVPAINVPPTAKTYFSLLLVRFNWPNILP